jgi:hypothetical protein
LVNDHDGEGWCSIWSWARFLSVFGRCMDREWWCRERDVLRCGLDSFHFLIGDGERWRGAGSWDRFNSELLVSKLGGTWSRVPFVNREG